MKKKTQSQWWKEAIVYQIYPRSFYDTDGDGIGDLRGIIEKLDYIESLGVNVIWICPMYQSPMDDNGYDISDYYQVAPEFGTNADMKELITQAHARHIKIILDLVVNHCSDEHPWFQKALAEPDSPEADYFYFKYTEDGEVPNNWRSNFGGAAWTHVGDHRYYLHTFGRKQPDLNWENPQLREEIYTMINWWLEQGIDGFRIDAITFIKKDLTFSSGLPDHPSGRYMIENMTNYEGIDLFLTELKQRTFAHYDAMTVAEAPGVPLEQIHKYSGEDGHFSMIFEFSYADLHRYHKQWSIPFFREAIFDNQKAAALNGWYGVFLENHDHIRSAHKYFSDAELAIHKDVIQKLVATLFFFLRGTPFIYQGQEIGMSNYPFQHIDDFRDISSLNSYAEWLEKGKSEHEALDSITKLSRDHSRTPMQWNNQAYAGFSTSQPWINVHPDYPLCNVDIQQQQHDSLLSYYQQMIQLRQQEKEVWVYGDFHALLVENEEVIAYVREAEYTDKQEKMIVLCNFSNQAKSVVLPEQYAHFEHTQTLISNYTQQEDQTLVFSLQPYEARVCRLQSKGEYSK